MTRNAHRRPPLFVRLPLFAARFLIALIRRAHPRSEKFRFPAFRKRRKNVACAREVPTRRLPFSARSANSISKWFCVKHIKGGLFTTILRAAIDGCFPASSYTERVFMRCCARTFLNIDQRAASGGTFITRMLLIFNRKDFTATVKSDFLIALRLS